MTKKLTFAFALVGVVFSFCSRTLQAGTFIARPAEDFVRKDGAPVTVVRTFSILDPSASYKLRVYNGGRSNQFAKISSAVITLNGLKILRPNDFNQQVTLLQRIGGPVKRLQARDSW